MSSITVARRFNGPPTSGNGGYSTGLIASTIGESVAVRLHQVVPMDRPMQITQRDAERWEVRDGENLIATARRTVLTAEVPPTPTYTQALAMSKHYVGFREHGFPDCFVCGPERKPHDGLCIFPGSEGAMPLASPWIPDETLSDGAGKVRPEFIWAALDCPGYFATAYPTAALLGEFAVHIDRLVHIDESCVVIAWPISRDGRKHRAGTALFGADGQQCAVGVATWVELKKGE